MTDTDTYRELAKLRADLCTARHAIVELDDALTALRVEHAEFRQHAAANLASLNELAAELTAEVAALAGKDEDGSFVAMTVGVLRALTFNLGYQFRGEPVPGDWDPDAEYARLAGETEADKPASTPPLRPFTPWELADGAIGLFLEYRDMHGQDEEDARRSAALEVAAGAAVTAADLGPGDEQANPVIVEAAELAMPGTGLANPAHFVQYAVRTPDRIQVYGDQSWVKSGTAAAGHPDGGADTVVRDIWVSYGPWRTKDPR